jgi:polyhydroxyalkanoate synthesis regulator phasin
MAQDFEQILKDVFGESMSRISQFQNDQVKRLTDRLQELAREAMKDDVARLQVEINELRTRVATLEEERAANAADSIQSSF